MHLATSRADIETLDTAMPQASLNYNDRDSPEELLVAIRHIATESLRRGISAPVVAGLLTYVAAEMSLQLAPSPLQALPVLLDAISKASVAHGEKYPDGQEEIFLDRTKSAGAIVH